MAMLRVWMEGRWMGRVRGGRRGRREEMGAGVRGVGVGGQE